MSRDNLMLQIHQVQDELLLMGSMVEQATLQSVETLKNRDKAAAKAIYNADRLINEKRYAIENSVLILIATQQPLAHDLRLLAALLEIAAEIERMGDYAKGICKVVINLEESDIPVPIKEIEKNGHNCCKYVPPGIGCVYNRGCNYSAENSARRRSNG